jgi:DnaK suppressor protein
MTPEDKDLLRAKILAEMDSLRKSITQLEESSKPVAPDNAIGRLTRMEAINSKSIHEASLNASRARLTRLERALATIDSPEFGICTSCEDPIPLGRIMVMPEATLCVSCADRKNNPSYS